MRNGIGIVLDFETADRITIDNLTETLVRLRKDQIWFEASPEYRKELPDNWVHPDDYRDNRDKYIPALETIIAYFGGEV